MIARFIAARGVTRCPTAVLVPTSAVPDPADAAAAHRARDAVVNEAAVKVARARLARGRRKSAITRGSRRGSHERRVPHPRRARRVVRSVRRRGGAREERQGAAVRARGGRARQSLALAAYIEEAERDYGVTA